MSAIRTDRGFTLYEVVIVLAVLAILTAVAIPSLTGQNAVRAAAAARRFAADLRYAQRLAMATHRRCALEVTGDGKAYSLKTYSLTSPPVPEPPQPADPETWQPPFLVDLTGVAEIEPPSGTVTFDARGQPMAGSTLSFTVGGTTVALEPETGALRP